MQKRSRITAEPIGHHDPPPSPNDEKAFRRSPITPLLHQDIRYLTVLIGCFATGNESFRHPDEYLVDLSASTNPWSVPPQSAGVLGTELPAPQTNRLIAEPHASGGKHLFNVPKCQGKSIVEPQRMGDHLRRKPMPLIGRNRHCSVSGKLPI
jgi:hypothetical protein